MLRMVSKWQGFRFERDQRGAVMSVGANSTEGRDGESALLPLCLVHFQGRSKELIPEFKSFLDGERQEFVIP